MLRVSMLDGEGRIFPGTLRGGVVECVVLLLIGGMRRLQITLVQDGGIEVLLRGFGLRLKKG